MAGRPRTSSRSTIEEAAAELFLENTFARTTIDQITQRAGVSRATFFNYFTQKTDLLWVGVDDAIRELEAVCTDAAPSELRARILETAASARGDQVPLVLSQQDLMGSSAEVTESGLVRVAALAHVFSRVLDRTAAYMLAGAVTAAWIDWARAGVGRDPLEDYVTASLARVATE
jgi:AcrR family transcriptional regulator